MHFVNEEYSGHYFGLSFFSPLGNLLINLLSDLLGYLASCAGEQSQESLRSWINHIDFMQGYGVNDLFSFLYLSLRTVYKSCLWSHCIVVWSPREASSCLWNFAWSLVDGDDVSSNNLLFLNGFDHFLAQIVNCFHLSGLEGDLSSFGSGS